MVQVSADNNILVAGGDDDLIHIWNIHPVVQYTNIKGRNTSIQDFIVNALSHGSKIRCVF